jgi:Flp pilus assembly protein TadD
MPVVLRARVLLRSVCWIALLTLSVAGCAIARRFGPTDESEIAARELARLGLDALSRGQLAEAEARFTHALSKSPKNVQARHHLAQLLWQQGQRDRAVEEMDAAVQGSGGDPDWTVDLGQMLYQQNDMDGALRCADAALQAAPQHAGAWKLRGDLLSQRHDLTGAKQAYHRSLARDPAAADALTSLAEIYRLEGKPLRALATLQRLEEITHATGGPSSDLFYRQALAMQALGRYDAACERFAKALPGMPDNAELLLQLSECQWQAGRIDEARQTLVATQRLLPHDPRVRRLADALNGAGPAIAVSY